MSPLNPPVYFVSQTAASLSNAFIIAYDSVSRIHSSCLCVTEWETCQRYYPPLAFVLMFSHCFPNVCMFHKLCYLSCWLLVSYLDYDIASDKATVLWYVSLHLKLPRFWITYSNYQKVSQYIEKHLIFEWAMIYQSVNLQMNFTQSKENKYRKMVIQ